MLGALWACVMALSPAIAGANAPATASIPEIASRRNKSLIALLFSRRGYYLGAAIEKRATERLPQATLVGISGATPHYLNTTLTPASTAKPEPGSK